MSKYTVARDLKDLSTKELLEVFFNELHLRIEKNKAELVELEQIAEIFKDKITINKPDNRLLTMAQGQYGNDLWQDLTEEERNEIKEILQ